MLIRNKTIAALMFAALAACIAALSLCGCSRPWQKKKASAVKQPAPAVEVVKEPIQENK